MFNCFYFIKYKLIFLLALAGWSTVHIVAQNSWSHYDDSNGLLRNDLTDVLIEDAENIWLASTFGLIKFNSVTKTFGPEYTIANQTLMSQNISQLAYANDRLWLLTDNGVSSIQGNVVTHYNRLNGLLSNDVRDLAVDTSGRLWYASPNSVSYFDGNAFVHDTTVSAYHIEIDDSNRVFIINRSFNILFNNNGPFLTHQVFDGNSWTQPAVSGLGNNPVAIYNIRLKKTHEGIVILSRDFDGGYYKLTYPFHLDSVSSVWQEHGNISQQIFRIQDLTITPSGKTWVIGSPQPGVFSTEDSLLQPYILNPPYEHYSGFSSPSAEVIESGDEVIVICSSNGIYVGSSNASPPRKLKEELSINNIKTSIDAYSSFFNDFLRKSPDFEIPKGSNVDAINLSSFFQSSSKINDAAYDVNFISPYERNYSIGPVNDQSTIEGEWLVKITRNEINNHLASLNQRGYVPPEKIQNWFAKGNSTLGISDDLAPFVDTNGDGCYTPLSGDYPAIKGDEAIYWINHIGKFEYHGMLYAYNDPLNALTNQTIFMDYTIINRDTLKYDSIKVGMFVDFDLGFPGDDYVGCDTLRNTFYVYNGDLLDNNSNRPGYGNNAPAVGIRFLSDSLDGFVSYHLGAGPTGQGTSSLGVHNYLNSTWSDGVPIYYGGNGRDNTNYNRTKFMYSGDPFSNSGWTELTPGQGLAPSSGGDRTALGSIPYFSLSVNERKTISLAIGYGQKSTVSLIGENIPELINVLDNAKQVWLNTSYANGSVSDSSCAIITSLDQTSNQPIKETSFSIFPNPANDQLTIIFDQLPTTPVIEIISSRGQLVKEIKTEGLVQKVNLNELSNGLYFIKASDIVKKLIVQK